MLSHPCETCARSVRWYPYAQCLSCLRYGVRPESDPGTGEVPRIRLMTTLVAEDATTAAHRLRQQREQWEQAHPTWIPRYLGARREYRPPARDEKLGRYLYEIRYTLRRQRVPKYLPWLINSLDHASILLLKDILSPTWRTPVIEEAYHET